MSSVDIPFGGKAMNMTSITARSSRPAPWLNALNLSHLSNRERLRTSAFAVQAFRSEEPLPYPHYCATPPQSPISAPYSPEAPMPVTAADLARLPQDQRRAALEGMSAADLAALEWFWPFWARPDQLPPEGDWRTFLLLGGR